MELKDIVRVYAGYNLGVPENPFNGIERTSCSS